MLNFLPCSQNFLQFIRKNTLDLTLGNIKKLFQRIIIIVFETVFIFSGSKPENYFLSTLNSTLLFFALPSSSVLKAIGLDSP